MSVHIGETPFGVDEESARKEINVVNQLSLTAAQLPTLVNSYTINLGGPQNIIVPND